MKPIWTGAISFGLVNIPVRLFPAVQDSSLDLDMLDRKDHSNIKFKRVNENTGKEVPYGNIVKGYLYNDKYVVLDEDDFESADTEKTNTIEILHFVNEDEIDSIYYEQPYYLEPEKSGAKAYSILRDALAKTRKTGVSTFVMRNKEALAILKPYGRAILLNRIRFQEEIKSPDKLDLPGSIKSSKMELDMAAKLVEQLTVKFDIKKYRDTYTQKLLNIIKHKAKTGKKIKVPQMKVVHRATSDNLMNMLKASLNTKKKKAL